MTKKIVDLITSLDENVALNDNVSMKNEKVKMIDQEGIKIELEVIDQDARVMLVSVSGYVDQANCYLMQDTIDKCLADKFFCLVFDLQKLMYMSSAGWGVLIGEIKRFRENGGDIKLANMGPEIYEIYQMLEFYHIISEYPSAEDALNSFNIKSDEFSEEKPVEEFAAEEEEPVTEDNVPEEEILETQASVAEEEEIPEREAPAAEEEEIPEEEESEEVASPGEELAEEDIAEEESVEEETSLTESSIDKESGAEKPLDTEEAPEESDETIEDVSVEVVEEDAEEDNIEEEADIEETFDEESEPEETPEPEEQAYYIEEDSIDELPLEDEKPKKSKKPSRLKEAARSEKTPEKKDTPDDNPQVVLEDEIDINIEGFLANEGIAVSGPRKDKSNYIEFDPDKYNRKFNIKVMPVPDKIKDIISKNPELSPRQIRNMLKHPDYGNVKISYLKFKSLLKALELDTKEKRYRYYRSA